MSTKKKTSKPSRPAAVLKESLGPLRLDLGCGPNKKEGFTGLDKISFPGVDITFDLSSSKPWPFDDNSVDEVHCSHFLEHLSARERTHFMNELCRVLKVGAKALLITPHWASNRAYGDPTHQWPPISEMFFNYLVKSWRISQAPHTDLAHNPDGYSCDFDFSFGYSMHPELVPKNQATQQYMLTFNKEAAQDTIATLTKR